MSDLSIGFVGSHVDDLRAVFHNTGAVPFALTFWWNRTLRITDAAGAVIDPRDGPVLPCGAAEDWLVLAAGASHERAEPLGCTQPAGRSERIGWSFALAAGTYRVAVVYQWPPPHGFSQSAPRDDAFRGRVVSNEIAMGVDAPKQKGIWQRITGR